MKHWLPLTALLLGLALSGCTGRTSTSGSAPDPSSVPEQSSAGSNEANSIPEGLTGYEQDGYILWFPARYSVDGTEIYETDPADGEEYRVAGIRPTEAVADPTIPFSDWDTRYTDAVQVTDLELNTLSARCYHLQEVDEESVVGGYRNPLVYCICLGDRMAVIELTPLMGRGGISSTRDPFEEALFYTTTAI